MVPGPGHAICHCPAPLPVRYTDRRKNPCLHQTLLQRPELNLTAMLKGFASALCLAATLLLTGCATGPQTPPKPPTGRPAPAPAPAQTPPPEPIRTATILGSEESSALLDNFTAFVAAVDGKVIPAGRKGWETPVVIRSGKRRLSVEFNRGAFVARAELELTAKAEAAYQLKYESDAQVYGKHSYCDFWIIAYATGERVTPVRRAAITSLKQGG